MVCQLQNSFELVSNWKNLDFLSTKYFNMLYVNIHVVILQLDSSCNHVLS